MSSFLPFVFSQTLEKQKFQTIFLKKIKYQLNNKIFFYSQINIKYQIKKIYTLQLHDILFSIKSE